MPVWCHRCRQESEQPDIWRPWPYALAIEMCPACGVRLDDIVPSWRDRLKAAKPGEAGLYDPVTGRKVTHK